MSWVRIDHDRCDMCGLCVQLCIGRFRREGGSMVSDVNEDNCNLCGHCVAICPSGAITHELLPPEGFEVIDPKARPTAQSLVSLVKARRSCRRFKKRSVEREVLQELIDACRYAPTGSNVQDVKLTVIQDGEAMDKLTDMTLDFFRSLSKEIQQRVSQLQREGRPLPASLQYALETLPRRQRLFDARQMGLDPIFYRAPVLLIFHSPQVTSTPKDNCVIAAHTLVLLAEAMGLGTCYVGLFEAAANGSQEISNYLGIPEGHRVYSVLILGYPLFSFPRTVYRKPIEVKWV